MDISDMCKWNNNDKDQGEPQNKNFIIKCYNIKFTSQNITATEKRENLINVEQKKNNNKAIKYYYFILIFNCLSVIIKF